jgi:hypothetical protein
VNNIWLEASQCLTAAFDTAAWFFDLRQTNGERRTSTKAAKTSGVAHLSNGAECDAA